MCGKMVGRFGWRIWIHGDYLVRQWWPGEGTWGKGQVWSPTGWRDIREDEIVRVFPTPETLQ